jgi:general secretion pathway protein L
MTACRIRVTRDTPASGAFEWASIGKEGEVLAAGAGDLAQSPVKGACELVLASDLVTLDTVAAPPSQQRRIGSALRFLAEELALPDPEQLHVAAAPGPAKSSLCLAIVDRQWLASLLARLENAGLIAVSAYPESLLPALELRTWTVVSQGDEGFARTGESQAVTLDRAAGNAAPVALQLALERARAEGAEPQAIVVRPVRGTAAPDVRAWAAALGIPVEAGPEWHWAGADRRPDIELLQGEFTARRGATPWLQRLRRPAIMAAALLALSTVAIALDWGAKVRERKALLAEMHAIYRETFGESAAVVDAPLQMSRALAGLRQQAGYAGREDFLALLRIFAEELRDTARHRIESVTYEASALTVTLRPAAGLQPATLLNELRAKPLPQGYEAQLQEGPAAGAITLRLRSKGGA